MGKNRKEQAAYDMLHTDKVIKSDKLRWSVKNKWWRWNSERSFHLVNRLKLKLKSLTKAIDET